MPGPRRNRFKKAGWILEPFVDHSLAQNFDCENDDLNDFFRNDLTPHENQLLTKTYVLTPKELVLNGGLVPVALISYCNDKIRLEEMGDHIDLPDEKRIYSYLPAVKIARLGVCKDFRRSGIGTHLINMTKSFFLKENRTGCRILTVDAYKDDDVLNFYKKNHFDFVTSKDSRKQTRTMFYDLIRTKLS